MKITLTQVVQSTGIDKEVVETYIRKEWISPCGDQEFDDEDVARIHLIQDLKVRLGVNDEGIPVILHLLDQVYYLRGILSRHRS